MLYINMYNISIDIHDIKCPITGLIYLDLVLVQDGKIYERAAITKWFKTNKRSPVTNKEIGADLVPAVMLRNPR